MSGAFHAAGADQSGHPVKSLGGGPQFPTEILGQLASGHRLKDRTRKYPLPALGEDPLAAKGNDALERVKETILSGVDHTDFSGRYSWFMMQLSL
jgi:hypothetical protein